MSRACLVAMVVAGMLAGIAPAAAPAPGPIEPRARELLQQMSDHLASLQEFSVSARHTNDVMLATGQKLQFDAASNVSVRRPNRLRSHRVGDIAETEFIYDGSTATVFAKGTNYYASAPVPPTIDGMLDAIRTRLGVEPAGADLLYADVYGGLMPEVTEAFYVGQSLIGGAKTHHLAFRSRETDFELWIEDGSRPLPRKYVITSKWRTGAPQFGVELSNWELSPRLSDALFSFTPPPGAQKVDFLTEGNP